MAEETPRYVPIEDRKLVRDMHSKAILNRDESARNAYMRRRNMRRKRVQEVAHLRQESELHRSEIAELRAQIEALSKAVGKKTTRKTTKKAE